MKRLADAQKRTFGKKLRKPMTHQDGRSRASFSSSISFQVLRILFLFSTAVTSGDYYMFQESPTSGIELCDLDSDLDRDSKKQTYEKDTDESSPNIGKVCIKFLERRMSI